MVKHNAFVFTKNTLCECIVFAMSVLYSYVFIFLHNLLIYAITVYNYYYLLCFEFSFKKGLIQNRLQKIFYFSLMKSNII